MPASAAGRRGLTGIPAARRLRREMIDMIVSNAAVPAMGPARPPAGAVAVGWPGMQIAVHAIGDGAVPVTIDGPEAARHANGARDSRHRIEPVETIDPAHIPRSGAGGLVARPQSPHPPGAMEFPLQPTPDRIGRARWRDACPWRGPRRAGPPLVFASVRPVADVPVMRDPQAVVTRRPPDGCAEERIGLTDSLVPMRRAAHRDRLTGTNRGGTGRGTRDSRRLNGRKGTGIALPDGNRADDLRWLDDSPGFPKG